MKPDENLHIGSLVLQNRLIMSPMTVNYGTRNGEVSERSIFYYTERAKSGIGLIVVEGVAVRSDARAEPLGLGIWSESQLKGLEQLAQSIHAEGTPVFLQLLHYGRSAKAGDSIPVSASAVASPKDHGIPHELSESEIEDIIHSYIRAAKWAKACGYDGIDIGHSSGQLLCEFLSPLSNQRRDRFGGPSVSDRTRLSREILHRIRQEEGMDKFPIIVKLCTHEYAEGGIDPEMAALISADLSPYVDAFIAHGGSNFSRLSPLGPLGAPTAVFAESAKTMKQKLPEKPILLVGGIYEPNVVRDLLADEIADGIVLAKAMIADAQFPRKTIEKKDHEIQYCIRCFVCVDRSLGDGVRCVQNSMVGNESKIAQIQRNQPGKLPKVVIFGLNGISGQLAFFARRAGCEVRFFHPEFWGQRGGLLRMRSMLRSGTEVQKAYEAMVNLMDAFPVNCLEHPHEVEGVLSEVDWDLIFISPPCDFRNGLHTHNSNRLWDVMHSPLIQDKRIRITGGQTLFAAELAIWLRGKGVDVTLNTTGDELAVDTTPPERGYVSRLLREKGVRIVQSNGREGNSIGEVLVDANEETRMAEDLAAFLPLKGDSRVHRLADRYAPVAAQMEVDRGIEILLSFIMGRK